MAGVCAGVRDGRDDGRRGRRGADKYWYALGLLLLAFVAVGTVRNSLVPVHVDEANWLMQTHHLSAGYFLHPPFIVYQQFVITRLFGTGRFALRVGSLLFTTGSIVLVFSLASSIFKDSRRAFYTALLFAVLPSTNYWLMTGHQDAPFIFFFLAGVLLVWKALDTGRPRYWYLAGLAAGLMLLCNLRSVFFPVGVFLVLITSGERRKWLGRKEPYLALGIAVLLFVPTLVWYGLKHFEPVIYQLTSRAGFLQGGLPGYLRKVFVHVGWENIELTPLIYLFIIFGTAGAAWLGFKRKDPRFTFLFWFSAPMIVFFTITGGQPYWALPGSMAALVAAVECISILLNRDFAGVKARSWKVASLSTFLALAVLVSMMVNVFLAAGSVHAGWKELSSEVAKVKKVSCSDGETYFASPYYFISSEIAYYEGGSFHGFTVGFNAYEAAVCNSGGSGYTPWTPLAAIKGRDVIFVDEKRNPDGYDTPVGFWESKLHPYFESIERPVIYNLPGSPRTFYIFACHGFKGVSGDSDCRGEVRSYLLQTRGSNIPEVK